MTLKKKLTETVCYPGFYNSKDVYSNTWLFKYLITLAMLLSNLFLHLQKQLESQKTTGKIKGDHTCRTLSIAHCKRTTITILLYIMIVIWKFQKLLSLELLWAVGPKNKTKQIKNNQKNTTQFCGWLASFIQNFFNLIIIRPSEKREEECSLAGKVLV